VNQSKKNKKMKWIIAIGINAMGSFLLQTFFPWWSIMIFPFLTGLFLLKNAFHVFIAGFLGIFLLWLIHGLLIDGQTNHIISQKIAELFGMPSSFLIIIVAAIIGGIEAGLSGLTGSYLKKILAKEK
jgi:hypothetical protein